MIATLRARTNHYETLGLRPTASAEEIEQAFAREIMAPRPSAFGGLVEVSVAYETLRDPAKRQAHDAALGLKPEPLRFHYSGTARWGGTPFPATVRPRPVHDSVPPPPEPVAAEPAPEPVVAALPPEPSPAPPPQAPSASVRQHHRAAELRLGEIEDRPVEWKRPAILIGAPIAAVVLLGAIAGSRAGKGEDQQESVTAPLPPAKPRAAKVSAAPPPEQSFAETQPRWQPRTAARLKRRSIQPPSGPAEDPLAAQPEQIQVADATTDPAPAAEAPAVERPAAMPLPNAAVARTLNRIGYKCGQVASTSAVEGARGVYTVNCTSGASYQAKPVRGRYHFRRVGSR
jgi:hypothetical protein